MRTHALSRPFYERSTDGGVVFVGFGARCHCGETFEGKTTGDIERAYIRHLDDVDESGPTLERAK